MAGDGNRRRRSSKSVAEAREVGQGQTVWSANDIRPGRIAYQGRVHRGSAQSASGLYGSEATKAEERVLTEDALHTCIHA